MDKNKEPIEKVIKRNSECEMCGDYMSRLQIKVYSETKDEVIVCRKCFKNVDNKLEDR